jgi:hypothetical protein
MLLLMLIILFNSMGLSTLLFVMCVEIVPFKVELHSIYGLFCLLKLCFIPDSRALCLYFHDFCVCIHVRYIKGKHFLCL